ncbi:MAG: XTP/dITP diphosphohydrolase [Arenicella sp.]|jgi:XTP/dITP diphosphohydrolase
MLGSEFELVSLDMIGCTEEIPETQPTIEGNSLQKAQYVWDNYKINCFADDTGLEVEALNNEPGVYSARYAGELKSDKKNMALVLERLADKENRKARFKTVFTLMQNGESQQFEGIAKGELRTELSGEKGFGYDPIFQPENHEITFAEMSPADKNQISHRGKALRKLVEFLKD